MRAVRVECAYASLEHDARALAALQCISWDFRSMLGMVDGNLRIMVECITIDGNCPPPGTHVGGIHLVEILEEWNSDILTHHLVVMEFAADLVGHYFHGGDLAIIAGSNFTANGLVLQIAGRHEAMVRFLRDVRSKVPVERVTSAKSSKGLVQKGPTLQQHRVVRLAHEKGWYEVPKRTSIRDLAENLGLSKSTVSEQLVKAEGEIVASFLDSSLDSE
ncbi:MAG: helix-turn-helix domain-containing protein [Candidatus Thalassarchaeaceae archaeon]|nr:helix-turn-helix domain-containing protein [Candidatus Thalassarchaeaceae archaeon]